MEAFSCDCESASVDASMETRTAMVDGRPTIQVAIVMSPDPSWEQIGQLTRE